MMSLTPSSVATPKLAELQAPAAWQAIDFISDLHLSPGTPRTFAAWSAYLRETSADAVMMLGDLFEVWVGDDARHEDFDAECAAVLSSAAKDRALFFMAGNRDFLVGADMLEACGLQGLNDPTVLQGWGQRLVLTHGDELCLADLPYQQFRAMVRSPEWQHAFLSKPLAERRAFARAARAQSEQKKQAQSDPSLWADVDFPAALDWLERASAQTMIHGHTHRPDTEAMAPGQIRYVLSDWDLEHATPRAEVLRLSQAGLRRLTLEQARPS